MVNGTCEVCGRPIEEGFHLHLVEHGWRESGSDIDTAFRGQVDDGDTKDSKRGGRESGGVADTPQKRRPESEPVTAAANPAAPYRHEHGYALDEWRFQMGPKCTPENCEVLWAVKNARALEAELAEERKKVIWLEGTSEWADVLKERHRAEKAEALVREMEDVLSYAKSGYSDSDFRSIVIGNLHRIEAREKERDG